MRSESGEASQHVEAMSLYRLEALIVLSLGGQVDGGSFSLFGPKKKERGGRAFAIRGVWLHAYLFEFLGDIKEPSSDDREGGLAPGGGMGVDILSIDREVKRGDGIAFCGTGFLRT